jgi:hypothetical protein
LCEVNNNNDLGVEVWMMERFRLRNLAVILVTAMVIPSLAFGAIATVKVQSAKYIPEISQYWDDETGVPPWVAENTDTMNADWERFLGNWNEISTGLSQEGGVITFRQYKEVCAQDVYDSIDTALGQQLTSAGADMFLQSAVVMSIELVATAGNFNFVNFAGTVVAKTADPQIRYPFSGAITSNVITLTPMFAAPDIAILFKDPNDASVSHCAVNDITVKGVVPTTEVTFDVYMTLDVTVGTNDTVEQPSAEEVAVEAVETYLEENPNGSDDIPGLSYEDIVLLNAGAGTEVMTEAQFDYLVELLDEDGNGQLSLEELQKHTPPNEREVAEQLLASVSSGEPLSYEQASAINPFLTQAEFDRLDADGDGVLTEDELKEIANPKCGCGGCGDNDGKSLSDLLGDWLLVGLSLMILLGFTAVKKH